MRIRRGAEPVRDRSDTRDVRDVLDVRYALDTPSRGKRNSVGRVVTPVLLACLAMAVSNAAARHALAQDPADSRYPGVVVPVDSEVAQYALRAVEDLTADGAPDLLLQAVARPHSAVSTRWLEVHEGPFGTERPVVWGRLKTTFILSPGEEAFEVTTGDMNSDESSDLVFALASRRGIEAVEYRKVSMMFGRSGWEPFYYVGEASRGDRKLEWLVPLQEGTERSAASRLTVRLADLNADGHVDLIVAADPPPPPARRSLEPGLESTEQSEIGIMFGDDEWLFWQAGDPSIGLEAGWVDRGPFRVDVLITGLGRCAASLGDVADVTGDGRPELLVRRCAGGGVPDVPDIVLGRQDWPDRIVVDDEFAPRPGPEPGSDAAAGATAGVRAGSADGAAIAASPSIATSIDPIDSGFVKRRPAPPSRLMAAPPPLLARDLSGDGIADLVLTTGFEMHVWNGGPDIASRLKRGRSDRVILGATLAGAALSGSWAPAELDGEPGAELLLARRRVVEGTDSTQHPDTVPAGEPLHIVADRWRTRSVIDLRHDPARTIWRHEGFHLAGIHDLDGDGVQDVLVASHPQDSVGLIGILHGPIVR